MNFIQLRNPMTRQLLLFLHLTIASLALARVHRSVRKYQIVQPEVTFLRPEKPIYGERNENRSGRDAIRVRFNAFGDNVDIVASRTVDPALFGTKLEVRGLEGVRHVGVHDFSPNFYELSNATASAFLYLMDNGQCMGKVSLGDVKYYIEPTSTYFRNVTSRPTVIIYKDSDVRYPRMTGCTDIPRESGWSLKRRQRPFDPYANVNADVQDPGIPPDFIMFKSSSNFSNHVACEVKLVADTTLYRWMNKDYHKTAAYAFIHAKVTDRIFRKANLGPVTVRLAVKKIQIFTDENDPEYPFREYTTNFIKFLRHFAAAVDTEHCLSIVICSRQFDTRAIGHAYLAYPDGRFKSGVCAPPSIGAGGVRLTYNKGAITTINMDNENIPLALTLRSFAHEVGHSFGSPHDPGENVTCSPGGKLGHYLLYDFAQYSGILSETLSPCSESIISSVVKNNMHCLKPVRPFCGNGIKEMGEECDCGTAQTCDLVDKCCIPKGGYRYYESYPECTYRRFYYYVCSAQEDACCTPDCTISSPGKVCSREAGGCLIGKCDGVSKDCPKPAKAPDGISCMGMSRTCSDGKCVSKSLCLNSGLRDCTCTGWYSCSVCCWKDNACQPVYTLGISFVGKPLLPFGTPCGEGRQCNTEGRCIVPRAHVVPVQHVKKQSKWIIALYVAPPVFALIMIVVIASFCILRRKRADGPSDKRKVFATKQRLPWGRKA